MHITADELASPAPLFPVRLPPRERPDPYEREKAWLRAQVPPGARVRTDTLKAAAAAAGIPWRRVRRAADDAGICHDREGFPSFGVWYYPVQWDQSDHPVLRIENAGLTGPTGPTAPLGTGGTQIQTGRVTENPDAGYWLSLDADAGWAMDAADEALVADAA